MKPQQLGFVAALIIIVNNMMGSGIYMLPASLAKIGSVSIITWSLIIVGVLAFAIIIVRLSMQNPDGGSLIDFVENAYGKATGSIMSYIYSIANWVALVSLCTIISGYAANLSPIFKTVGFNLCLQLSVIWLFTLICIMGARVLSFIQTIAFSISLIPIIAIAIFGWHWFSYDLFKANWLNHAVYHTSISGINHAFNTVLWSFIGVESICVLANIVKDAQKNVMRATIIGLLIVSIIYIAICMLCMGIVPRAQLALSNSPLADVLQVLTATKYAVKIISLSAILGCIGALIGWMLVTAEILKHASLRGIFIKQLSKVNQHNVPATSLIFLAVLYSLIIIMTISQSAQEQFNKIISLSVILYLIVYIYATLSSVILLKAQQTTAQKYYNLFLAIVVTAFFSWSIYFTNYRDVALALLIMLFCLFLYTIRL